MKKEIKTIIFLIVLIIIICCLIIFINLNNNKYSEYKGNKDLSVIETSIENNEYYEFEENGQKYILFKIIEGVYAPNSIKIKSANITKREYIDNILYLEIDVKTDIKESSVRKGEIVDGYNTDSKIFIIKVKNNFDGLYINNKKCNVLADKVIGTSINVYIEDDDKFGYMDKNGNLTIPVEYNGLFEIGKTKVFEDTINDYIDVDLSNYLRAVKNDKTGIIDKQGNIIVDIKYDQISVYSKDAFVVTIDNNSKIGILDKNNELIKGYVDGGLYNNNRFGKYLVYTKVENNTYRKGVLDRNLNIKLEPIYDDFKNFNFTIYNNYGKYNKKYFGGENGNTFSRDYIVVEKDNQTAILDTDYNFITSFTDLPVYDIRKAYENELLKMLSEKD